MGMIFNARVFFGVVEGDLFEFVFPLRVVGAIFSTLDFVQPCMLLIVAFCVSRV